MSSPLLIVTAADSAFFEWVRGTILSIRDQPLGRDVPLAFFDLGCTDEQLDWLGNQVTHLAKPDWEVDFPGRSTASIYLRGLTTRPFLRQYFPGYEVYLWIDADAWVQDWSAVDLFERGARRKGMAVVPEIDRGSLVQYGKLPKTWRWAYEVYEQAYGPEVAEQFHHFPMINAGVFAIHNNAPHWQAWAELLTIGLQRSSNMIDQFALNLAVYGRGLFFQTEMLPVWCNWTCHFGPPAWDTATNKLVEPYLPHVPIGILHLTRDKLKVLEVATTAGGTVTVPSMYSPQFKPE